MRRRAHKRTYLPYLQNRREKEEKKKKCSGHLLATSSIGGGRRATGHTHSITHLKVNPPPSLFPCFGLMTLYIRNEKGGGDSFFRAGGEEKTGAKGYHHHHHRGERKEEKESLGRVLFKRTGRVIAEALCPILKVLVERRPVLSPFFRRLHTFPPPPFSLLLPLFWLASSSSFSAADRQGRRGMRGKRDRCSVLPRRRRRRSGRARGEKKHRKENGWEEEEEEPATNFLHIRASCVCECV